MCKWRGRYFPRETTLADRTATHRKTSGKPQAAVLPRKPALSSKQVLPRKQALSRNLSLLMDADPTFLAMSGLKRQAEMILDGTRRGRQHGATLSERHHGISV